MITSIFDFSSDFGVFVPQTLYKGFGPGPHWGLASPGPLFCAVQKILKLYYVF